MRKSKKPLVEELRPFAADRAGAAAKFGVSPKTVVNWLRDSGLYEPRANYGCNKLDMAKARQIRELRDAGAGAAELAAKFGVTVAAVYRVLNNVTYRVEQEVADVEVADVKVVYNPATNI
jgi:lambda repressor-like predicted transcriptional regulator